LIQAANTSPGWGFIKDYSLPEGDSPKRSPVVENISNQKEVAAPPKNKIDGSQRHKFTRCTAGKKL
jgi:hypothetical protein